MKAVKFEGGVVHEIYGPHRASYGWVIKCTGRAMSNLFLTDAEVSCKACIKRAAKLETEEAARQSATVPKLPQPWKWLDFLGCAVTANYFPAGLPEQPPVA